MAREYPDVSVDEDLAREYLNELRESGATNMFGAGEYLAREYGITTSEANAVLCWWMEQF